MKKIILLLLVASYAFASMFTLRGSLGGNVAIDGDSPNYAIHTQVMHFLPVLPNIRLEKSKNDFRDDLDIIFFYNILDETLWLSLDLGIGAKVKKINETDYKEVMPSIFASIKTDLPFSKTSLKLRTVSTKKSTDGGHKAELMIEYKAMDNLFIDMVVDIGYRDEYFSNKTTSDKRKTIFFELSFTI